MEKWYIVCEWRGHLASVIGPFGKRVTAEDYEIDNDDDYDDDWTLHYEQLPENGKYIVVVIVKGNYENAYGTYSRKGEAFQKFTDILVKEGFEVAKYLEDECHDFDVQIVEITHPVYEYEIAVPISCYQRLTYKSTSASPPTKAEVLAAFGDDEIVILEDYFGDSEVLEENKFFDMGNSWEPLKEGETG